TRRHVHLCGNERLASEHRFYGRAPIGYSWALSAYPGDETLEDSAHRCAEVNPRRFGATADGGRLTPADSGRPQLRGGRTPQIGGDRRWGKAAPRSSGRPRRGEG